MRVQLSLKQNYTDVLQYWPLGAGAGGGCVCKAEARLEGAQPVARPRPDTLALHCCACRGARRLAEKSHWPHLQAFHATLQPDASRMAAGSVHAGPWLK